MLPISEVKESKAVKVGKTHQYCSTYCSQVHKNAGDTFLHFPFY